MTDKEFVPWDTFGMAIRGLASQVTGEFGEVDNVLGISRGGLPGAVTLSHTLDADFTSVDATHYDGEDKKDHVTVGEIRQAPIGDVLIFDDIVDTGETMGAVESLVEGYSRPGDSVYTASLDVKPHRTFEPDVWLRETEKWVVYPWEAEK